MTDEAVERGELVPDPEGSDAVESGGFPDLGASMPDLGGMLTQAMEMQSQMMAAQAAAAEQMVEGQSGGGAVRITVTGGLDFRAVQISPDAVDPDDVELLQDLVLAALHDAVSKLDVLQQQSIGGIGDLLGGGGLGDIGGLLGLSPDVGGILIDDDDEDDDQDPRAPAGEPDRVAVYAAPVQDLIDELGRLPGVGPKSAQRIAFHLLKVPKQDAVRLAVAITEAKDRVSFCPRCFNIAEGAECGICTDPRRDATVICVVEESRDIVAVEKTGEFRGRYHVLQGAISPIEGIGPDQLRVKELLTRVGEEDVQEVILCTNPNIEGEATAMYLGRLLKPLGLRVTRIASGLPVGGDLEYADELTLGRALEGRRDLDDS